MGKERERLNPSWNQLKRNSKQKMVEQQIEFLLQKSKWNRLKRKYSDWLDKNFPDLGFLSLELFLKLLLWFLLLFIFVRLEFATVYIIISIFVLIFVNLGHRRDGELSAYHVFNENFKELPGTLRLSQLEREMMIRTTENEDTPL